MKKKSTSQSAFFNLRVLIGLFTVLAGVFLALIGLGTFSGLTANSAKAQQTHKIINVPGLPPGFDCAQISALGIDKQENLLAGSIMIACGESEGGSPTSYGAFSQLLYNTVTAPLAYGGTDVDLINPQTDAGSHITQSETMSAANPDNADQIVVAYNDSRSFPNFNNISGASASTDGGATFTRLTANTGRSPFDNTFGDPVVMYNRESGVWFTVWLDIGCGGQGLGGYKTATPADPNSWTHFCVHSGSSDDRESGAVDNNPASPNYGNMYVSWNDFASGGGALKVRRSTDDGLTWGVDKVLNATFIRDVQITVDLGNGDVYVAAMDEGGGGFPHNDTNKMYRSTDGGNTFSLVYTGPVFPGPGVTTCASNSYFACMFNGPSYWRHEGWGQPAANNGVVGLVYAQRGTSPDPGDVYYIRSTDKGVTFGAPFKLNSDTTTRPQWQPNLSAADDGSLLAVWYDARESTTCAKGNPAVPCYRMWARKSTDGGATWLADMEFSDIVTPLPGQPDPNIVTEYVGDYDYSYHLLNAHLHTWVDGRVAIGGQSQQDPFFDQEGGGGGGGIPCGDLVSFQVRCKPSATGDRLQAKVTFTDTSHSGEQVTITVDGNPNSVTITGNLAKLQINNPAPGAHTVELTDPAGCFAPVNTNCP
jgi:hypothetical protein